MRCKDIIIIGAGGHAKVIVDIIEESNEFKIKGFLDDNKIGIGYKGHLILDRISNACKYNNENTYFVIAIGDNNIRKEISETFDTLKYATIIHKSAIVSDSCKIGEGSVVFSRSIINADSVIKKHVIINTGAIVEHDCVIYDYCHISPGSVICGGNIIYENVQIGSNSVVIPNKVINKNSIIGAGSTVIKNIEEDSVSVGCPTNYIHKMNYNLSLVTSK